MLTRWREGNRARWVGVRPGHHGEQVAISKEVTDATIIVYTVPAAKRFFLCDVGISYYAAEAGTHFGLGVRDDVDTLLYYLWYHTSNWATASETGRNFWPPIEIPAGYDVFIYSSGATRTVHAFIHGWVQDEGD